MEKYLKKILGNNYKTLSSNAGIMFWGWDFTFEGKQILSYSGIINEENKIVYIDNDLGGEKQTEYKFTDYFTVKNAIWHSMVKNTKEPEYIELDNLVINPVEFLNSNIKNNIIEVSNLTIKLGLSRILKFDFKTEDLKSYNLILKKTNYNWELNVNGKVTYIGNPYKFQKEIYKLI